MHTNINSTMTYTHVSREKVEKQHKVYSSCPEVYTVYPVRQCSYVAETTGEVISWYEFQYKVWSVE